jgi:zinc ribbon protein
MTEYLQALRRFWSVVVLGVCAGSALALFMLYQIGVSWPPTLTARAHPSYRASTRLLLTSSTSPLLRTSEPQITTLPGAEGTNQSGSLAPGVDLSSPPNLGVLVQAANVYPVLIESDQVRALRVQMFGRIPGSVSAQALFAIFRPFGGFVRSDFPVIEITAVSPSPGAAVKLTSATARAFIHWLELNQARSNVRPKERVLLQELQASRLNAVSGGLSYGLPILAGFSVLLAFAVLAVLFQRVSAHRRQSEDVAGLRPVAAPATSLGHSPVSSACVNCGSDFSEDARFCPQCGYPRGGGLSAVSPPAEEHSRESHD